MATGSKTGGRQKGTPNKSTEAVRMAIAKFADGNVDKLQEWLERVAEDDPARAADLFLKVLEYHVPKLGRTEHTGMDGADLQVTIVKFGDATPEQLEA